MGLIVDPQQAEGIVAARQVELVAIGREALHQPNFPFHAQQALGAVDQAAPFADWPPQIGWWLGHRDRKLRRLGPWLAAGGDRTA
ncbi:hypothetical protein D3C78_1523900 [compost metagenome]